MRPSGNHHPFSAVVLLVVAMTARLIAKPVSLSIPPGNNSVVVSWPAGPDLVQPQKRTNLAAGAWQDLGAATAANALTESASPAQGYFRLRFLAPEIITHPQGRTNATGSNVTFSVPAAGTASLAYQSRKDNTLLVGKTEAVLGLTDLALGDAGTGTHANNAGYYTGTYAGQFRGSAFAVLAADGSIFFYTIDDPNFPTADGDGGGFGTINAANSFSGATVPLGLTVVGTLKPATKVLSGYYRLGSTTLGTFNLTCSSTP